MEQKNNKPEHNTKNKILTIVGTLLCVILIPILIVNCTLIVKSYLNSEEVPTFGGFCPMIVLTDSMNSPDEDPKISKGDLIICKETNAESIVVGDVISFFDPESNGTSVVTHKVIEIINEDGALSFRTKGTNNNTADATPVPAENLVGVYQFRIPFAGHVAIFLQTTPGLIVCIVLPIILFVAYEILRSRKFAKAKQADTDALLKELEELRRIKAEKEDTQAEQEKDKTEKEQ